jgi:hypothetical protein
MGARVSLVTTLVAPTGTAVVSPLSGRGASCLAVELLERVFMTRAGTRPIPAWQSLGLLLLGDVVTLRAEDANVAVSFRRARLGFAFPRTTGAPLPDRVPPELVPLVRDATRVGTGELGYREHLFPTGTVFRLGAFVEATQPAGTLVTRDDLGPVPLDETLERPWSGGPW